MKFTEPETYSVTHCWVPTSYLVTLEVEGTKPLKNNHKSAFVAERSRVQAVPARRPNWCVQCGEETGIVGSLPTPCTLVPAFRRVASFTTELTVKWLNHSFCPRIRAERISSNYELR